MKQSLKILKSYYNIDTKDKLEGNIKDFLFDEKQWVIRYIDADFGKIFSPYKVLIPKVFFKNPEQDNNIFPTSLSKQEIEKCPKIGDHLPVSRKYEEELNKHFEIKPYWMVAAYMGTAGAYYPPRPISVPTKSVSEKYIDTILRSFDEVKGYHVEANDGKIGHIDDLLIDYQDWQIVYAVIDTSNWLPWSKKVIIPIDKMSEVSYTNQLVKVKMKKESIKNAPEYNPDEMIVEDFEKGVFDFYSQSMVL
ncbi:MAG: hypothetical protein C0595_11975 [Marinilabiliales bacterium]|nr:MAG: hypothetical protein C0595_11975 [Marinilabiliales bacterium]